MNALRHNAINSKISARVSNARGFWTQIARGFKTPKIAAAIGAAFMVGTALVGNVQNLAMAAYIDGAGLAPFTSG